MPKNVTKDDDVVETYGVWVSDDDPALRREAATAAEAVKFAFDGWSRVDKDKDTQEEAPAS